MDGYVWIVRPNGPPGVMRRVARNVLLIGAVMNIAKASEKGWKGIATTNAERIDAIMRCRVHEL